MGQNDAARDAIVSPAQEAAIAALLAGKTVTEAAQAAQVHRSTVHRWLGEPIVIAELNSRRLEHQSALGDLLMKLQTKAVVAVERALDAGDARVAIAVLRGSGILDGRQRRIGTTDPDELARTSRIQARREALMGAMEESELNRLDGDIVLHRKEQEFRNLMLGAGPT